MSTPTIEEGFEKLLGRQATEAEKANLYRVRDALGIGSNDALWLIVMMLEAYQGRLAGYPKAIEQGVEDALRRVQETVVEALKVEAQRRARELVVSMPGMDGEKVALPWTVLAAGGGLIAAGLVMLGAVCMVVGATLGQPTGPAWALPSPAASAGFRIAAAIVGAPAGWVVFLLGLPVGLLVVARGVKTARDGHQAMGWMMAVSALAVAVGCVLVLVKVL